MMITKSFLYSNDRLSLSRTWRTKIELYRPPAMGEVPAPPISTWRLIVEVVPFLHL